MGADNGIEVWTAGRGFHQDTFPFVWYLTTGTDAMSVEYTNWKYGEPNLGGSEYEACISLDDRSRIPYKWKDERCTRELCYVCE